MRKASIEFEKKDSVQAAIKKFDKTTLNEYELSVAEFVLKEKKAPVERAAKAERKPRAPRTERKESEYKKKGDNDADRSEKKPAA